MWTNLILHLFNFLNRPSHSSLFLNNWLSRNHIQNIKIIDQIIDEYFPLGNWLQNLSLLPWVQRINVKKKRQLFLCKNQFPNNISRTAYLLFTKINCSKTLFSLTNVWVCFHRFWGARKRTSVLLIFPSKN